MITAWLAGAWAKVETWLAIVGAVIAVVAMAFVKGRWDGERLEAAKEAARAVKTAQAAARVEVSVQSNASTAIKAVQQKAAQVPAPDPVKRDDFDTTQ